MVTKVKREKMSVDLHPDLHRKAKIYATISGQTLRAVTEMALRSFLKNKKLEAIGQ